MDVTATQAGSTAAGTSLQVLVLTGARASQAGAASGGSSTGSAASLSQSLIPAGTGSLIVGSLLQLSASGAPSGAAGTTVLASPSAGGLIYAPLRSTGLTAAGVAQAVGVTNAGNSAISIAALEILAAAGNLTVDPSTPANAEALATSVTTAAFTPPDGALLAALIATNGGAAPVDVTLTDTSGLGLTWTEAIRENPAGNGSVSIWLAQLPAPASAAQGSGAAIITALSATGILP